MQASDAKVCNFNFSTFKSAVCVLVLQARFDLVTDIIHL